MKPSRPTAISLATAPAAGLALYVAATISLDDSVIEVAVGVLGGALSAFWPDHDEQETDRCSRCQHLRRHHHGPCQACLRDQIAGAKDHVPCGRFRRAH